MEMDKLSVKKKGINGVIFYVLLTIFMIAVPFFSLDGFHMDFDTYPSLAGDGAAMAMHIRSIQENGLSGLYYNPRIGAPNKGSHLVDANGVDFMLGLMIWLLDKVFHPSTARLYYYTLIFTFVAVAWSMSLLFKKLNVNVWVNFVFSSLYALGPYHFYRYLGHMAIGNAFTVPLAILLCLYIIGIVNDNTKKERIQYAIYGLMVGLGCAYFTFFAFVIMSVAVLMKLLISKSIRQTMDRIWVFGITVLGFLLSRLPAIILNMEKGKNSIGFARSAAEQEIYGLKIIQMLLPVSYSKVDFLRKMTADYNVSGVQVTENVMSSLGIIASIGFCVLCGLFFYSFFTKELYKNHGRWMHDWKLIDFLSVSTLSLVLAGSIGGFGEIFNIIVTPQIRCYNRASIYITCFGVIIMAYLVNCLCQRKRGIAAVLAVILLIIGLYDQVVVNDAKNGQVLTVALQDSYEKFFGEVQTVMGDDAMIYELPYMSYPEAAPINGLVSGKHFVGYLLTEGIRWSYGGIKGRDKKARKLNIDNGMSYTFLNKLLKAGFDAVYIDMDGYAEGDTSVLDFYYGTGIEPLVSDDGKLYLWDIRGLE